MDLVYHNEAHIEKLNIVELALQAANKKKNLLEDRRRLVEEAKKHYEDNSEVKRKPKRKTEDKEDEPKKSSAETKAAEGAEDVEADGESLFETIIEAGEYVIEAVGSFLEAAIITPIADMLLATLGFLLESAASILARTIIMPLLDGAVMLALANPIGIGVALVAAGGFAAYKGYEYYKKTPEQKTKDTSVVGFAVNLVTLSKPTEIILEATTPVTAEANLTGSTFMPTKKQQSNAVARFKAYKGKQNVQKSLETASTLVGVPLSTLVAFAGVESSYVETEGRGKLQKNGKPAAAGLFQFIASTWKTESARAHALYPQYIPVKADPFDALQNAIVGAVFLKEIKSVVDPIRPNATAADYYLGHFLGPTGGPFFLKKLTAAPNAIPANDPMYASGQKENFNRFYFPNGTPKTYLQIYAEISGDILALQQLAATDSTIRVADAQVSSPAVLVGQTDPQIAKAKVVAINSMQQGTAKDSNQDTQLVNVNGNQVKMKVA